MMTDLENYLLSAFFFFLLCCLFYWWKHKKEKRAASGQEKFIFETLELAQSQFEIFNLKLHTQGTARTGLSALTHEIGKDGLLMEVNDFVSEDWANKEVDVFFRVRREEGPVFYVFSSCVKQLKSDYENSRFLLTLPKHIQVEKRRHFPRVKPQKDAVRVIGVWPIKPGKRLPRATNEMGPPLTHYKHGEVEEPVQVEDISASGLALRFALDKNRGTPADFPKGAQILCLIVYVMEHSEQKPTAFWCTCEVMNSRIAEGNKPALVLGLEFTNWAVLEQGTNEIHWAHSSPSRGAKPMSQWVEKIEAARNMS